MFAYCNNNPIFYRDDAGFRGQSSITNTAIILDPEGNRPQTLADYVARQYRYSGVKEKEKQWARIYKKTMDSAAESTLEGVDEALLIGGGAWLLGIGAWPTVVAVISAGAVGFLYGAIHGFVDAVQEEGIMP